MLNSLISYFDNGNKAQFSKRLGISPQGISTWIKRNTFDSELIFSKCENINASWLLTGEGEMIQKSHKEVNTGVPFYEDLPVSAGKLDVITADESPSGYINLPGFTAKALFPVVGCSMKPDINPGDVIGIETVDHPERIDPDKVYLIITSDQRMIKHLEPDPYNNEILWGVSPNYQKIKIYKSEIKFIYQVTYVGRLI